MSNEQQYGRGKWHVTKASFQGRETFGIRANVEHGFSNNKTYFSLLVSLDDTQSIVFLRTSSSSKEPWTRDTGAEYKIGGESVEFESFSSIELADNTELFVLNSDSVFDELVKLAEDDNMLSPKDFHVQITRWYPERDRSLPQQVTFDADGFNEALTAAKILCRPLGALAIEGLSET